MALLATRRRGFSTSLAPSNAALSSQGRASTISSSSGGGSAGVIFNPDMEAMTDVAQVFTHDRNTYGYPVEGSAVLVTDPNPRPGTTKSVRLRYPNDEAGVELQPPPFDAGPALFARHYMRFSSGWATNWPYGLKTSRFFTRPDFGNAGGTYAYISEKLIWNGGGSPPESDTTWNSDADSQYGLGLNCATQDQDLITEYTSGMLISNGQPYIRENVWYKCERWYVLNSAVDVHDGIMQIWINDVLVVNRTNVAYKRSTNPSQTVNGTSWQSMWFGGNYSGATFGGPTVSPLDRYESGYYLSSTLDR